MTTNRALALRVSARQLPLRRCLVDHSGDVFGQHIRDLVHGNAEFVGQLLQVDRTNSLVDLLGGDRKIGTGGHPRLSLLSKTVPVKVCYDAVDTTVLSK
jgi:hypothetical protein